MPRRFRGDNEVRMSDIEEVAAVIPDAVIDDIFAKCKANSYEVLEETVKEFIANGYPASRFLQQFLRKVVAAEDGVTDSHKAKICLHMGEVCTGRRATPVASLQVFAGVAGEPRKHPAPPQFACYDWSVDS